MKSVWRATIGIGFIISLLYSNLLMREFERSGPGQSKGLVWAIGDLFTADNFMIAVIVAFFSYILLKLIGNRL